MRNSCSRDSRNRVLDLLQIGIVITGMTNQFPGSVRKILHHQAEQTLIQRAGGDDGQSPIRR